MRHGPVPLAIEQTLVPNASNVSDTFEPAFDPDVMASSEEAVQCSTFSHDLAKRHRVKLWTTMFHCQPIDRTHLPTSSCTFFSDRVEPAGDFELESVCVCVV